MYGVTFRPKTDAGENKDRLLGCSRQPGSLAVAVPPRWPWARWEARSATHTHFSFARTAYIVCYRVWSWAGRTTTDQPPEQFRALKPVFGSYWVIHFAFCLSANGRTAVYNIVSRYTLSLKSLAVVHRGNTLSEFWQSVQVPNGSPVLNTLQWRNQRGARASVNLSRKRKHALTQRGLNSRCKQGPSPPLTPQPSASVWKSRGITMRCCNNSSIIWSHIGVSCK